MESLVSVRIVERRLVSEAVVVLELEHPMTEALPPFSAGAHIDLHLGNGQVRSYSLTNPRKDERVSPTRYQIAVARDEASRGGSVWIHDKLKVGDSLRISAPRNNFPLNQTASTSYLLAGGIGVTPLWAMAQQLDYLKREWRMVYCARSPRVAAFATDLNRFREVSFHFDGGSGGKLFDIDRFVASAPDGTHFYCCGPPTMLTAFEIATASHERSRIHTERFKGVETEQTSSFTVILAKSGRTLLVKQGESILDTVVQAGIDIPFSCTEGVCGACETEIIEGIPDHRDLILSESDKAAGKTMMICCSGAKSQRLILNL